MHYTVTASHPRRVDKNNYLRYQHACLPDIIFQDESNEHNCFIIITVKHYLHIKKTESQSQFVFNILT